VHFDSELQKCDRLACIAAVIRLIFFISGIKMHSSVVSCLGVDITLLLLVPMPTSSGDVVAVTSDLYLW
jgi:hypothetical protein